MVTRRAVLIGGGAMATVVAGTGFAGWYPGTASATAPWRRAGQSLGDARLDALAFAILAPNPHNRQPWQFTLVGEDGVDIRCDLDRRLPHTDPFDRQIVIGFGCMIELLVLAAAQRGYAAEVALFPDGEPQPTLDGRRIASVTVRRDPNVVRDPLGQAIVERRSTKTIYPETPVPPQRLAAIIAAAGGGQDLVAGGSIDAADIAALTDLAWRAWMIEYETARTRRESIDLMRIGNAEITANPDGIELGGVVMGLAGMTGMISRDSLDRPGSSAYQQGIDMFEPIIASAKGYVWLTSAGNSRIDQIAAGRAWVRMNLAATAAGVAMHPLSQCLQEFPEMAGPFGEVHRRLAPAEGARVQMLGRIGIAPPDPATPRWPLETRLVAA
jgi:hypothetical protein